jgi:hypothetical protein
VATPRYNVVRVNKNTPGARAEPQSKLLRDGSKSLDFSPPAAQQRLDYATAGQRLVNRKGM